MDDPRHLALPLLGSTSDSSMDHHHYGLHHSHSHNHNHNPFHTTEATTGSHGTDTDGGDGDMDLDTHSHTSADEHSSAKIQHRITRACATCRSRRKKCDGTYPCGPCIQHQRTCVFTPAKKRGPPPRTPSFAAQVVPTLHTRRRNNASASSSATTTATASFSPLVGADMRSGNLLASGLDPAMAFVAPQLNGSGEQVVFAHAPPGIVTVLGSATTAIGGSSSGGPSQSPPHSPLLGAGGAKRPFGAPATTSLPQDRDLKTIEATFPAHLPMLPPPQRASQAQSHRKYCDPPAAIETHGSLKRRRQSSMNQSAEDDLLGMPSAVRRKGATSLSPSFPAPIAPAALHLPRPHRGNSGDLPAERDSNTRPSESALVPAATGVGALGQSGIITVPPPPLDRKALVREVSALSSHMTVVVSVDQHGNNAHISHQGHAGGLHLFRNWTRTFTPDARDGLVYVPDLACCPPRPAVLAVQRILFPAASFVDTLVDYYFGNVHPFLPFLSRAKITAHVSADAPSYVLLYSVLAVSALHLERRFRIEPSNGVVASQLLLARAKALVQPMLSAPTPCLLNIQSLLLIELADRESVRGNPWLVSGMAIRMALDLGLNLGVPASIKEKNLVSVPTWSKTWIYCSIVDSLNSFLTGRSHMISDTDSVQDLDECYLNDANKRAYGAAELLPADHFFVWLFKLFEITGKVGRTITSIRIRRNLPYSLPELHSLLSKFRTQLPRSLVYNFERPHRNNLGAVHLNLLYLGTVIFLYRTIFSCNLLPNSPMRGEYLRILEHTAEAMLTIFASHLDTVHHAPLPLGYAFDLIFTVCVILMTPGMAPTPDPSLVPWNGEDEDDEVDEMDESEHGGTPNVASDNTTGSSSDGARDNGAEAALPEHMSTDDGAKRRAARKKRQSRHGRGEQPQQEQHQQHAPSSADEHTARNKPKAVRILSQCLQLLDSLSAAQPVLRKHSMLGKELLESVTGTRQEVERERELLVNHVAAVRNSEDVVAGWGTDPLVERQQTQVVFSDFLHAIPLQPRRNGQQQHHQQQTGAGIGSPAPRSAGVTPAPQDGSGSAGGDRASAGTDMGAVVAPIATYLDSELGAQSDVKHLVDAHTAAPVASAARTATAAGLRELAQLATAHTSTHGTLGADGGSAVFPPRLAQNPSDPQAFSSVFGSGLRQGSLPAVSNAMYANSARTLPQQQFAITPHGMLPCPAPSLAAPQSTYAYPMAPPSVSATQPPPSNPFAYMVASPYPPTLPPPTYPATTDFFSLQDPLSATTSSSATATPMLAAAPMMTALELPMFPPELLTNDPAAMMAAAATSMHAAAAAAAAASATSTNGLGLTSAGAPPPPLAADADAMSNLASFLGLPFGAPGGGGAAGGGGWSGMTFHE
ncbi:fungal-specific transcription factor domain-containing protein [Blastocladiella britannica]|nr:fungal-specific transcription factor domain-containing protein [Blastocladiella britannica]